MKRIAFAFYFILFCSLFTAFSQDNSRDVVYLKDGSIIHGTIIEQKPDVSVTIKTKNGSILVLANNEIAGITTGRTAASRRNRDKKNTYWGFYGELTMSRLRPDGGSFADDLSAGLNGQEGFYNFRLEPGARYSFTAGWFVNCRVIKCLYVQTGLDFIMKGIRMSGEGTLVHDGYTYHTELALTMILNYLSVPLYAKFYPLCLGNNGKLTRQFNIYIFGGPDLSYAASRKMKMKLTLNDESDSQKENYSGFNTTDISLNIGAGMELARHLDLQFKYSLGLCNTLDRKTDNYNLKNSTISLCLGFTNL